MEYYILQKAVGRHKKVSDENFCPKQLKMGIKIEKEHTNDEKLAKEIAKDHLAETPDYYTRLKKMEAQAKKDSDETKSYPYGERTIKKKKYRFEPTVSRKAKEGEPPWHETIRQQEMHGLPQGLIRKLPHNIKVEPKKVMKLEHLKTLHKKGKIHMAAGLASHHFPYSQADTLRWMQEKGKHKDLPHGKVVTAVDKEGRKWSAGYFHKSQQPVPVVLI